MIFPVSRPLSVTFLLPSKFQSFQNCWSTHIISLVLVVLFSHPPLPPFSSHRGYFCNLPPFRGYSSEKKKKKDRGSELSSLSTASPRTNIFIMTDFMEQNLAVGHLSFPFSVRVCLVMVGKFRVGKRTEASRRCWVGIQAPARSNLVA